MDKPTAPEMLARDAVADALTLPAVMPVMTFEVSVEGDDIYVDA